MLPPLVVGGEDCMTKFDIAALHLRSRPAIGVYITIVVYTVFMIIWLILYVKIK